MKTYIEQAYKTSIKVLVTYPNDTFIDYIKGLNTGHALHLARQNWEGAQIVSLQVFTEA